MLKKPKCFSDKFKHYNVAYFLEPQRTQRDDHQFLEEEVAGSIPAQPSQNLGEDENH